MAVYRVCQEVSAWLQRQPLGSQGHLLGLGSYDVLGALHANKDADFSNDAKIIQELVPGGISVLGSFIIAEDAQAFPPIGPVMIQANPSGIQVLDAKGSAVVFAQEPSANILEDYVVFHYGVDLRYNILSTLWTSSFHNSYAKLSNGVYLKLEGEGEGTVEDLLEGKADGGGEEEERSSGKGGGKGAKGKKKGGGGGGSKGPSKSSQSCEALLRSTPLGKIIDLKICQNKNAPPALTHAPVVLLDPLPSIPPPSSVKSLQSRGDVLIYAQKTEDSKVVLECIKSTLAKFEEKSKGVMRELGGMEQQQLNFLLFRPGGAGLVFPIIACYQLSGKVEEGSFVMKEKSEEDEKMVGLRKNLHTRMGLPLNKPLFRIQSALKFDESSISGNNNNGSSRLADVHIGLPPSGVEGGKQFLVDGTYLYYHYMQDRFDDKGWGCAYRSLQTIHSFFLLNGYTTKPVLTHAQIQQTLVDMNDKPRSFVGSNEWIGSMEVGYVLDQEMGITWRNLMTNTGPELGDKARELARHFEVHGTPVMMGGGNLAFTILGVDWNENTGDVKFLILDPHYTGAEDLRTIQGKEVGMEGYKATPCGWRSPSTFAKSSFYNLCLPQRPELF